MTRQPIPWARLLAEGVAIVLSILLAFAIDASWDRRADRRLEQSYLAGLERDLVGAVQEADIDIRARTIVNEVVTRLQSTEGAGQAAPPSDSIGLMLGVIRFTYKHSPPRSTLDDLITSGRVHVLQSDTLRVGLQLYTQTLSKIEIEEQEERAFIAGRLSPYLSEEIELAPAAKRAAVRPLDEPLPTREDLSGLLEHRRFRNLLFERGEYNSQLLERIHGVRNLTGEMLVLVRGERR